MKTAPMEGVIAAIRQSGGDDLPRDIGHEDSLVLHLGFDSMKIALLSLALEKEFGVNIALDEWLASRPDPHQLTVTSLCGYVDEVLRLNAPSAAAE